MSVYVEAVFLDNFLMDWFLLLASGRLCHSRKRLPWLGACTGAIWAVAMPAFPWLSVWPLKAVLSAGMLLISFRFGSPKKFGMLAACFLFLTAVGGGVFYLLGAGKLSGGSVYSASAVFHGVLYGSSGIFLCCLFMRRLAYAARMRLQAATVRLIFGDRQVCATGLVDTGNSLKSGDLPVIVVEASLFPALPETMPRVIPYSAVGKQGAMLGYVPDEAEIEYEGKRFRCRCVAALTNEKLSGDYRILIHPDLMRGADDEVC